MTDQEILEHNAATHGITLEQASELHRLIDTPMSKWPEPVMKFVKDFARKEGSFCMEVLIAGLVEWIKARKGVDDVQGPGR